MRVVIEGWEQSVPVRAVLDAPDASQVRAAERVTLEFECGVGGEAIDDDKTKRKANSTTTARVVLQQQPHLLHRSPPLLSACVWDCGLALAEWLVEREAREGGEGRGRGTTVVELGAGAGASGLAAAAVPGFARFVLLTDVAGALRGLRSNVTRSRLGGKVSVEEIDWSLSSAQSGPLEVFRDAAARALASASMAAVVEPKEEGGEPVSYPDLVLSADVCYPPPPSSKTGEEGDSATAASAALAEAEASAVSWAKSAESLCGPSTRVIVAFERRPEGVPPPEDLLGILMREARRRFQEVRRLDARGMAFAGARHLELYEFSGRKEVRNEVK